MKGAVQIRTGADVPLLWIDQRYIKSGPCVDNLLSSIYDVEIITTFDEVDAAIKLRKPGILCFDFDLPDQDGLSSLHYIKTKYPALPFIVLTKDHSVELAIWAFRLRAWDYFIKPVSAEELAGSIGELPKRCSEECLERRKNLLPEPLLPPGPRPLRASMCKASTALALSYVRQQYHNRITLDDVAKLCGMSKSHFSRTFKSEHGITFQDFLIQQRINKAVELLGNSDLQVTQVALAVGFTELSNFTRTFQRTIGILPTCYRKALIPKHMKKGVLGQSVEFPRANPNPVLSTYRDGTLDFINPAASQLLEELELAHIEDMLPRNHRELLKACLETDTALTEERKVSGRTIVWSYHSLDDNDVIHIYGHDISAYTAHDSGATALPAVNPNPVLSATPDGVLQFVNPAVSQLLQDLGLETVEEILPRNHVWLVNACQNTSRALTDERKIAGRTFVWSYHSVEDSDVIYIYGHDVSGYISQTTGAAGLSSVNTDPVFSAIPDGNLQIVNPAASRLLKELELETAVEILPDNHEGLMKACRKTGATLTEERKRAGRTIAWSYHRISTSDEIYIYGHDVSGLQ